MLAQRLQVLRMHVHRQDGMAANGTPGRLDVLANRFRAHCLFTENLADDFEAKGHGVVACCLQPGVDLRRNRLDHVLDGSQPTLVLVANFLLEFLRAVLAAQCQVLAAVFQHPIDTSARFFLALRKAFFPTLCKSLRACALSQLFKHRCAGGLDDLGTLRDAGRKLAAAWQCKTTVQWRTADELGPSVAHTASLAPEIR